MKKSILPLLLSTAPLFAGEPTPMMMAPPPACDCPQGWTAGLELLGLRPYQSEGDYAEDSFDLGIRGSVGYQFADCMFVKLTGFGYETDTFDSQETFSTNNVFRQDGETQVGYIDLVIGQHFTQCDKLTLSPYVGLRWASFEESYTETDSFIGGSSFSDTYETDFDGLGVLVGIDATRALGNNFSVYGTAKQSVVFGEADIHDDFNEVSSTYSDDRVIFISEIGLGVQYDFSFASVAANVRAGVEGQWWAGLSGDRNDDFSPNGPGDSENVGFAGFVLGANFLF